MPDMDLTTVDPQFCTDWVDKLVCFPDASEESATSTPMPLPFVLTGDLDAIEFNARTPVVHGQGFETESLLASLQSKLSQIQEPRHQEPIRRQAAPGETQVSRGSVGHPFTCTSACPYFRRKGGCRDGEECSKCHQCFWQRHPKSKNSVPQPEGEAAVMRLAFGGPPGILTSADEVSEGAEAAGVSDEKFTPYCNGSVGHPVSCASPCKYVRRKTGCRDGRACTLCHLCLWRRGINEDEQREATRAEVPPPPPNVGFEMLDPDSAPAQTTMTVGSIGHPFSCSAPCKYYNKPRGCKDGKFCVRCHLCRWRRSPDCI
mmetsp:Transcript_19712/g.34995  ORF Transcript_19712/g.34995 Transcript_19712/m.34995 type:complete len:316 (-) Transcript_19712:204-1151(-)|eukprot:CAMPEP_0197660272 /NCGR_PEP_ID=MMETSP1338-20131121/50751_1 /TAXON_ID=43686 ORGANISM="Pelagodinium beii, Strain RCC1491" /NCGR_SAMPLE_ID=MMETSP1338 /ASSEMBLY_ACC=CAM_ASM_000754 /LENGTH=315 /DNA_ID=CAMNT_0043237597 /DNA_START=93 /DNA_END=1040 /DNA_ORIENTATION=+